MAKVSRNMLKSIVKECLLEILSEGINNGNTQQLKENLNFKDSYIEKESNNKVKNPSFEDNTKKIISKATSDPVMASILEDTAKTTLQEQNGADQPNKFIAKQSDQYSQAVSESDPMEMFGGSSNNWASLAFSNK